MGFRINCTVGKQTAGDGTGPLDVRASRDGSLVTTNRHVEELTRGNVYVAESATAGIAIIQAAAGGGHPTLWNPLGTGIIINIKKLSLGYVSGNNAPTSICWNITAATGSTVATAAPIATFTAVAIANALAGGAAAVLSQWSPVTNTFTAAPAFYRTTGISLFTGVAATATAPFMLNELYDGDLGIMASNALSLVTQAATTTALFRISIVFEELPA